MAITIRQAHLRAMTAPLALGLVALILAIAPLRAATVTVTSALDSGSGCPGANCTLRQALAAANSGDTIDFAPNVHTIFVLNGPLFVNKSVTVSGPGARSLTVQRDIFALGAFPVFQIGGVNAVSVTLSGITVSRGTAGGISVSLSSGDAVLTISECTITSNTTSQAGAGIYNVGSGSVHIDGTTISGNTAHDSGGGIYSFGGMTITNSTITGNSVAALGGTGAGGGITALTVTIVNSSVAFNSAPTGGGISSSAATLRNTIVARNTASTAPDLDGTVTSQGFNLIGSSSGFVALATDQVGVDPLLDTLKNNGGPTDTLALLSGSPAIDKGHASGSSTDQRGRSRPIDQSPIANAAGGDGADIGAFESSGARIDADGNGAYDALTDGLLLLRYLFGVTGTPLTSGAIGPSATRTTPDEISAYLDIVKLDLDVDGDGQADALTDGLILIRYLFGLRGNSLTTNAIGPGATRATAEIETYIQSLMP